MLRADVRTPRKLCYEELQNLKIKKSVYNKNVNRIQFASKRLVRARSPFPVLLSAAAEIWRVPVLGISTQVVAATPADWIELISLHKQIDKV